MANHVSTQASEQGEAIERNTFAFLLCMETLSLHWPTWREAEQGNFDEDVLHEAAEHLLMECMPADRLL